MKFRDFLNNLDDPLKFYLQYNLKKLGTALDELKEEAMQLLTAAVGSHIAEVLYEMYLEVKKERKKLIAVSAWQINSTGLRPT
jgi:predicted ribosome quality control (RQC) complex YloA/Tae2 family protein